MVQAGVRLPRMALTFNLYIMKTLTELFEIIGKAVSENRGDCRTWFVNYSGHVNKLSIHYHFTGWSISTCDVKDELDVNLDEDGIQAAYWFIKTKLKKANR